MTAVAHEAPSGAPEADPLEVMAKNLRLAARLWSSATAFFFLAFLFAYFYLRALDQHKLWHPHNVKAPVTTGTLIAAAVVVSGAAAMVGSRRLRAGDQRGWLAFGSGAFALGVVAIVLQIVEWTSLGFGPTDGGFASVFLGWTGLYLLFLVGSLYWLETLLATSLRQRRAGGEIPPSALVGPGADAFGFYWAFLAGIGFATWIVLYLL